MLLKFLDCSASRNCEHNATASAAREVRRTGGVVKEMREALIVIHAFCDVQILQKPVVFLPVFGIIFDISLPAMTINLLVFPSTASQRVDSHLNP